MSLNNDLALAARRLNLVAEKLPEGEQSALAEAWAELSDQMADLADTRDSTTASGTAPD